MGNWTAQKAMAHQAKISKRYPEPPQTQAEEREFNLHREIMAHCSGKGWLALHATNPSAPTNRIAGEPDFNILMPGGKSLWVEVKARGKKTDADQNTMLCWLQSLGQHTTVVWSFAEFISAVEERLKLP